jgi:hypothetical protein
MGTRVAVLALAGVLILGTVARPVRARQRSTPGENPPDVKALVFELANAMGMLRGLRQEDSILTLEHWATGTLTVGQQRFEVPEYRLSVNYAVPGMRLDFTVKGPNGQALRNIQVVSGATAWNELERGKNATPVPNSISVKDRLAILWTTPMGVVKAAQMAGSNAKITMSGGSTLLSFPLPAPVNDVTVTATVRKDASLVAAHPTALKNLVGTYIVRVQTSGAVVMDTTYGEYGEWNWDDYRADIMLPRRILWKYGDQTLELTTKNTNTYNPYVVMPIPENVKPQAASR